MSEKEKLIQLLDRVPDYKMGYILAYAQGVIADEEADDAFCAEMLKRYREDPDPEKEETVSLEEAARLCGVDLDAIRNKNS